MFDARLRITERVITAADLERELAAGVKAAGRLVHNRVRSVLAANATMRTGKTLRSFRESLTVKPGDIIGRVRSRYFVGRLLEHGAKPHTIAPRRGRFLIFTTAGQRVFARRVQHPGIRARRFFAASTEASAAAVQQELHQAATRAVAQAPMRVTETSTTRTA